MSEEKVINFPSGPRTKEQAADQFLTEELQRFETERAEKRKATMLAQIDALRVEVEEGRTDEIILMARHFSGQFLVQPSLKEDHNGQGSSFAWAGLVNSLSQTLTDQASDTPVFLWSDGAFRAFSSDPYESDAQK